MVEEEGTIMITISNPEITTWAVVVVVGSEVVVVEEEVDNSTEEIAISPTAQADEAEEEDLVAAEAGVAVVAEGATGDPVTMIRIMISIRLPITGKNAITERLTDVERHTVWLPVL